MANQFVNLPAPASGNGAGAAVNVSSFGGTKTIVIAGSWPTTMVPFITIEINNDPGQAGSWSAVYSNQGGRIVTLDVAAWWMRQRVSNYRSGSLPQVDVGGTDDGTTFAALPSTASNGAGAAVDVSGLGNYKTITVGGTFTGSVIIEVSEDGASNWAQAFAFSAPGQQSMVLAAHWMRSRRLGVPVIAPGQPIVNVGAVDPNGSGGLIAVSHDSTMTGDGNGTPLSVIAVDGGTRQLLTNGSGVAIAAGAPVYIASANHFAKANAATAPRAIGLLQADTADGIDGFIQDSGPLSLTAGQWDAITGQVGGLTPSTDYYLDVTAGHLTTVAPSASGQSVVYMMHAVSTTTAIISPERPVLLA